MLGAAACALVPLGEVKIVASLLSLSMLTVFTSIHVALIVLRYRQPELRRPFRVPLSIGRLPGAAVAGDQAVPGLDDTVRK